MSARFCHTLNPRLFAEQLIYIINHAEDRYIFVDTTFLPILEAIQDQIPNVKGYIVLCDAGALPETKLTNAMSYEELVSAESGGRPPGSRSTRTMRAGSAIPRERPANPKGVLYSHRSNVIHGTRRCRGGRPGNSQRGHGLARGPDVFTPTPGRSSSPHRWPAARW